MDRPLDTTTFLYVPQKLWVVCLSSSAPRYTSSEKIQASAFSASSRIVSHVVTTLQLQFHLVATLQLQFHLVTTLCVVTHLRRNA